MRSKAGSPCVPKDSAYSVHPGVETMGMCNHLCSPSSGLSIRDRVWRMSTPVSGSGIITRSFDELSTRELHAILALRSRIFVVEQECVYNDIDGRDIEPTTRHLWISLDSRVAAYARQLRAEDGSIRIGRVVTNVADRGSGLARTLVSSIVDNADAPIALDAQSHLAGWYETFGFEAEGDEFIEDGIPHITMRKG